MAKNGDARHGLPVVNRLKDLGPVNAAVVTDLAEPEAFFDALVLLSLLGRDVPVKVPIHAIRAVA